jgi:hypothetical protein
MDAVRRDAMGIDDLSGRLDRRTCPLLLGTPPA